jgi:hypothetical protein
MAAQILERGAEIAQHDGVLAAGSQRAANEFGSQRRIAALARQHAAKVQGIGMIWLVLEHGLVQLARSGKLAALVQGDGLLHGG